MNVIDIGHDSSKVDVVDLGVLDDFFIQVEEIEADIDKISKSLKVIQDLNEKSREIVKPSAVKESEKRMEKALNRAKNIALAAKSKIEDLDRDNLANRLKPGCREGSSVDRSRIATTLALKRKWKGRVLEFQELRESIQQEYRDIVKRTVFTVTGNHVEDEVISHLMHNGNSRQIFQKVIQEQGRGQIMDTLADIQYRNETLKEIEKQLLELQQVFLDMSVLVEVQGELLNNIESQVSTATEYVQAGTNSLREAKKKQSKTRKRLCISLIVIFLIIVVVVAVVVTMLRPWKFM